MDLYFPIADLFYNPWIIVFIGLSVGFLSGLLGLGAGILITPLLLLIGFPARIAVASQVNASIGTNFTGLLNYRRRHDIDYALGGYLIVGGLMGALTEFYVLHWLYDSISPVGALRFITGLFLVILSCVMFCQIIRNLLGDNEGVRQITMKKWMIYIPFHRIFLRSRTEMSVLVPLVVGFLTGLLTVSLGGGLNTMMIPFLTYLIGRVSPCVSGTSFFVSTIVFCCVTMFNSLGTAPVDMILVFLLTLSTSIGSKIGIQASYFFSRIIISFIAAIIIFLLGVKTLLDVFDISKRRPKIILNNGVRHYLDDLTQSIPTNIGFISKKVLLFASYDPVLYAFTCIFLSILCAIIVEFIMRSIFYSKKKRK
jgi:uncharacterized membrane protein YfcA